MLLKWESCMPFHSERNLPLHLARRCSTTLAASFYFKVEERAQSSTLCYYTATFLVFITEMINTAIYRWLWDLKTRKILRPLARVATKMCGPENRGSVMCRTACPGCCLYCFRGQAQKSLVSFSYQEGGIILDETGF